MQKHVPVTVFNTVTHKHDHQGYDDGAAPLHLPLHHSSLQYPNKLVYQKYDLHTTPVDILSTVYMPIMDSLSG